MSDRKRKGERKRQEERLLLKRGEAGEDVLCTGHESGQVTAARHRTQIEDEVRA